MDYKPLPRQPSIQEQPIDPFQLISILNKKIKQQSQSIEWYKKMYQTSEYEKKITLNELKKKKQTIQSLKLEWTQNQSMIKNYQMELQHLKTKINQYQKQQANNFIDKPLINSISTTSMKQSLISFPYTRQSIPTKNSIPPSGKNINLVSIFEKPISTQASLQLKQSKLTRKNDLSNFFSNPNPSVYFSKVLQEKNTNLYLTEQFIPNDVKLLNHPEQRHTIVQSSQSLLNVSAEHTSIHVDEVISERPGEFFIEDFLVFGPDLSELRKKRDDDRTTETLTIKPAILYAGNHRTSNQHVYTEIAMRCFPFNATAKRQFIGSYEELKNIVQFSPQSRISSDCLILNLKGQVSEVAKENSCFRKSNLSQMQFIICLKVPDFLLIPKDERHYQRTEQQLWMVDKYYAIVSYFPFLDIHINILTRIHSILLKQKLNKILIEKQKFFLFDIKRNMVELQRNQHSKSVVQFFRSFRPDFGHVLFYKGHYFGTIPSEKESQYYIAKMTAPIFMTNFCFEEMLLLLIGLFCQKSIAFISKNQGTATLCALFLIGILAPFPYSFSVLLNVDEQKICPFVFEYPFPMISTIKKTNQNLHQVILSYATSRIEKKGIKQECQRMILVDIDTNSIFYQGHQTFEPLIFMGHPGQQFMKQYMKVNPSFSKSFSFPKKLDARKQMDAGNKRQQQRNRIVEDIEQTIKTNTMKMPDYKCNAQIDKVLGMLQQYVRSFAIQGRQLAEALDELSSGRYQIVLRRYLLERHPGKGELVEKIINSQYYADYLNMFNQH